MGKKHTDGPWEIREFAHEKTAFAERRVYKVEIRKPIIHYGRIVGGQPVCQIVDFGKFVNDEANARLIAAAPELLRALELIVNSDMAMREEDEGEISTELSNARAAIAKATA